LAVEDALHSASVLLVQVSQSLVPMEPFKIRQRSHLAIFAHLGTPAKQESRKNARPTVFATKR
jgi:hypothetical protein